MYLLNRDRISQAVIDTNSGLRIGEFDKRFLQHTFYYLRLGDAVQLQKDDGNWFPQPPLTDTEPLIISPGECVRVQTFEDFALDARYFAILGGTTDMALDGLSVLHGPFLDPHYPRPKNSVPLKLAIVNCSRAQVTLKLGDRIGKIAFFEISDTYPVVWEDRSLAAEIFRERGET